MARLALLVVAAVLLPAAAAGAQWSPPQTLSSPHTFVDLPAVTTGGDGSSLASWTFGGLGADAVRGVDGAGRSPTGGAFGRQRKLQRAPRELTAPLAYARSRIVAAVTRPASADPGEQRVRLGVRFGLAAGFLRPTDNLRTATRIRDVHLDVNARGDAAVAWFEDRGVNTDRVYVALRRAGGRFGDPVLLERGRIRSVSVAVGASGDVLVAWDARGTVETRLRPRGRTRFRSTDEIDSRDAFGAELRTAVAPNGRAVVAWSAQLTTEGGESGPVFFEAAVRPAGGERFRAAQTLEEMGPAQVPRPVDLAVDSTGRIHFAYSGSDGPSRRARVSASDASGRFVAPQDVSPPGEDAVLSDLAAGPGGRLIAVWDNGGFDANRVRAALAPAAGQPFGPAENVSPAEEARAGRAAFHPQTGVPTVVWTNRPRGSQPPVETFAQAATRTGQ